MLVWAPAAFALALTASAAAAPISVPPPARDYVSGFCAPIAMTDAGPGALRQHMADWGARLETEQAARAFQPDEADVPGQMVSFEAADAPHAFVERRRGGCALIYPGPKASAAVLEAFRTASVPAGQGARPATWRRIDTKRVGPPGPIRYFMAASEEGRYGLCATIFEDLRLHDATPATLVRVETCRIGPDDTFD